MIIQQQPQQQQQLQTQAQSQLPLQLQQIQFEEELQRQELQLQQQLHIQQLQLQQIQQMKKQLHQFQQTPLIESESKTNERSKDQEKDHHEKQLFHNTNQNSSISFPHNVIPLNASTHNNQENQNQPSTIDYDELPPSYDEIINN